MKPAAYQKRIWKENEKRIVSELVKNPLTFKELITASGLSRGVVNQHLQTLENSGVIFKKYENRKILNVLKDSKIDLVDWFLSSLESFAVPGKVIEEGRTVLSEEVLVFSAFIYSKLLEYVLPDIHSDSESLARSPPKGTVIGHLLLPAGQLTAKKQIGLINSRISHFVTDGTIEQTQTTQLMLKYIIPELNPLLFTVILQAYKIEELLISKSIPELKISEDFFFYYATRNSENVKSSFNKTYDWWFSEVVGHIPSSGFFQIMTMSLYQSLLSRLQEAKSQFEI